MPKLKFNQRDLAVIYAADEAFAGITSQANAMEARASAKAALLLNGIQVKITIHSSGIRAELVFTDKGNGKQITEEVHYSEAMILLLRSISLQHQL